MRPSTGNFDEPNEKINLIKKNSDRSISDQVDKKENDDLKMNSMKN
jgi:hypothetical protein